MDLLQDVTVLWTLLGRSLATDVLINGFELSKLHYRVAVAISKREPVLLNLLSHHFVTIAQQIQKRSGYESLELSQAALIALSIAEDLRVQWRKRLQISSHLEFDDTRLLN